jgi:DNA-binding phage protein
VTKTKTKTPLKLMAFDAARYLDDDAAIAEYMTAVLESNDPGTGAWRKAAL